MHFRTNVGTTTTFGIGRLAQGTMPAVAGVPYVLTLPVSPRTRSIVVTCSGITGTASVQVTGVTSGIEWTRYFTPGAGETYGGALFPIPAVIAPLVQIIPVYGAIDSSITVSLISSVASAKFSIVESSQDVMQGTPEQPIGSIDVYGPITPVTTSVATGVISNVLSAPPSGFMNEIHSILLTAATTTFVATAFARVQGTPSGVQIIGAFQQATGIAVSYQGTPLRVTEQQNCNNGTNVTANVHILYRQIPIPRGYV